MTFLRKVDSYPHTFFLFLYDYDFEENIVITLYNMLLSFKYLFMTQNKNHLFFNRVLSRGTFKEGFMEISTAI